MALVSAAQCRVSGRPPARAGPWRPPRRATLAGRELELTATEHDLLCALARNAGAVCAYDDLPRTVWKRRKSVDPKLVRAFVRRLRAKLGEDAENPVYVLTERGVGYRMPAPGKAEPATRPRPGSPGSDARVDASGCRRVAGGARTAQPERARRRGVGRQR